MISAQFLLGKILQVMRILISRDKNVLTMNPWYLKPVQGHDPDKHNNVNREIIYSLLDLFIMTMDMCEDVASPYF